MDKELLRLAPNLPDNLNPYRCREALIAEVPPKLNPFASAKVNIFLWLGAFLPLGNLKFYPAFWMLFQAGLAGKLKNVHTLVEASSGNMAYCLAILARFFGITRTVFLVPPNITSEKKDRLLLAGVKPKDIIIWNDACEPYTASSRAAAMGVERGWIHLGQYTNPNNPEAHAVFTAVSIWEKLGGSNVNGVGAGRGTNGTITGIRDYCRDMGNKALLVGTLCEKNDSVPGVRSRDRIVGTFDWESGILTNTTRENDAWATSLQLTRHDFRVGPAGGLAYAGFCQAINTMLADGTIDEYRNDDEMFNGVVICGDGPELYTKEYVRILCLNR